jgi:hypothetical protein
MACNRDIFTLPLLSQVYACVTNNKGFESDDWIHWQLLLQSLLIIINYKNSQSNVHSCFLHIIVLDVNLLKIILTNFTPTELCWLLHPLGTDHAQKTQLIYCCVSVCLGSHVIAAQPVHWRAGCCLATTPHHSCIIGRVLVSTCF